MEETRKKIYGIVGTVVFHAVLIAILVFLGFDYIEPQEEQGILVMVGDVDSSWGEQLPQDPDPSPAQDELDPNQSEASSPVQPSSPDAQQQLVTTDDAEAPVMSAAEKQALDLKKKQQAEELLKAQQERLAQQAREKEQAEQARLAEEKRKKEDAIKNRVANAFTGPKQQGQYGTGTSGTGAQGSPNGNSATGATTGTPGYGDYDLGGRGIRGVLPRPGFSINESGTVVVAITVNENGKVINAMVGKGTNTSSPELRNSAIAAAKKAVFEVKKGVATQSGTITYRFDSDN